MVLLQRAELRNCERRAGPRTATPTRVTRTRGPTCPTRRKARNANAKKIGAIRLTGQLTPRNKLGFYFDYQKNCTGSSFTRGRRAVPPARRRLGRARRLGGFGSTSPEAGNVWDDREKIVQANWSSPVTNRLLLEAGVSSFNSRWGGSVPAPAR